MSLIRYVQGENQFVGAFEGDDVGCRGRRTRSRKASLGPDQRERKDGRDEEDARWRASERDGRVKKGEERINGQLPENYIAG